MIHCAHAKEYPSHDWCRPCAEARAGEKPEPKFKPGDWVSIRLTGWGVMRVVSSNLVLAGMATDDPKWWVEYKLVDGGDHWMEGRTATTYESNLTRYIDEQQLVTAKDLLHEARSCVFALVAEFGEASDTDLLKRIDEFLKE